MPPTPTLPAAPPGGVRPNAALPIERVLPNSPEAERSVLGAMLLDPDLACSQVRERLEEKHFYSAAHQVIFREIAGLQDALKAVDLVTLAQRLRDKGLLEEIGGEVYLAELLAQVPTVANLGHYIDIVWEKHLLRRLIGAAHDIITRCFEQQDEVRHWIDEVEQEIFSLNAEKTSTGARPVRDFIKDAVQSIEKLYSPGGGSGLPTGFHDLDRLTAGLHGGNMIVIAARPSMGKTSLAMNIAENVAVDQKLPVAVFSLEMSAEELVKRMLCSRARVNLRAVRDGFLAEREFPKLTNVASELMKAPLFIDDTAGLTINQIRARARRLHLQHKLQLLVIDYLQLLRAPSRRAESSRQVEVADISNGIKALAKELNIPIIVLSQLNRQPEARDEGKPRLSDLRESGSIEQDADVVALLVRPELYEDDPENRERLRGKAALTIAKQRNGPTGEIELIFLSEYTRFENAARVGPDDLPGAEGRPA